MCTERRGYLYEKVWKKPVIVNQEEENANVEKEISKEEKENKHQP